MERYNREAGVRMGSYGMTLLRNKPTALKQACRCHQYPYISSRPLLITPGGWSPHASAPGHQCVQLGGIFILEVSSEDPLGTHIYRCYNPTFLSVCAYLCVFDDQSSIETNVLIIIKYYSNIKSFYTAQRAHRGLP